MIQLFIGIATFPCCGEPHLIYAGTEDEATCRAQFASTLDEAAAFRGGPATSSMFVEVGLMQLVQMMQLVQRAMEPEPEVHVVHIQSREQLDRRCQTLRRRLRESGHASLRELSGEHDRALAAALPIGARVGAENS